MCEKHLAHIFGPKGGRQACTLSNLSDQDRIARSCFASPPRQRGRGDHGVIHSRVGSRQQRATCRVVFVSRRQRRCGQQVDSAVLEAFSGVANSSARLWAPVSRFGGGGVLVPMGGAFHRRRTTTEPRARRPPAPRVLRRVRLRRVRRGARRRSRRSCGSGSPRRRPRTGRRGNIRSSEQRRRLGAWGRAEQSVDCSARAAARSELRRAISRRRGRRYSAAGLVWQAAVGICDSRYSLMNIWRALRASAFTPVIAGVVRFRSMRVRLIVLGSWCNLDWVTQGSSHRHSRMSDPLAGRLRVSEACVSGCN